MASASGWLLLLAVIGALHTGPGPGPGHMVLAQLVEPGICPFSSPVAEWSEERFVSEPWYELRAFPLPGLHEGLPTARPACTRWHFTPSEDGQGLHTRLAYRAGEGDGVIHAFAQYMTKEKHPRFNLTFRDLGGSGSTRSVDMKLVATDYDDFALLWGCSEPNLFERKVVSWVLSRQPVLSDAAEHALRSLFRRHDIRADKLVVTGQLDCGAADDAVHFTDVTALPDMREDSLAGSVFAPFRGTDADSPADSPLDSPAVDSGPQPRDSARDAPAVEAAGGDSDQVSRSYMGEASGWFLGPQGVAVAALLALAAVSVVASLLAFRALLRHAGPAKPVLPMRRQDLGQGVSVATLGGGVDYSRFGGLGQGLVQTRKHVADPCHSRT